VDRVKKTDIIGAGHNAVSTTDTLSSVYQYNPVFCLICGSDRADLGTGRLLELSTEFGYDKGLGSILRPDLFFIDFPVGKTIPSCQWRVNMRFSFSINNVSLDPYS